MGSRPSARYAPKDQHVPGCCQVADCKAPVSIEVTIPGTNLIQLVYLCSQCAWELRIALSKAFVVEKS